jgi:hypothetical protein
MARVVAVRSPRRAFSLYPLISRIRGAIEAREFKSPTGWGAEERPGFDVKVIGHYDRDSEEGSYLSNSRQRRNHRQRKEHRANSA